MMVGGFVLAYLFYLRWPQIPGQIAARHPAIYRFLSTSGISTSFTT